MMSLASSRYFTGTHLCFGCSFVPPTSSLKHALSVQPIRSLFSTACSCPETASVSVRWEARAPLIVMEPARRQVHTNCDVSYAARSSRWLSSQLLGWLACCRCGLSLPQSVLCELSELFASLLPAALVHVGFPPLLLVHLQALIERQPHFVAGTKELRHAPLRVAALQRHYLTSTDTHREERKTAVRRARNRGG